MFLKLLITECDMRRNLDLTALRSFCAVVDSGGVTRAAARLNLTQSAVSMQLKRLEEALGLSLLDRSGRGVATTPAGDQLVGYARRILALNDEAVGRLTAQEFEGEITLGVPHDIVYPSIPHVLQRFAAAYPRMRVNLISSCTRDLKAQFGKGNCGMILTTEQHVDACGETLVERALIWLGAPDGQAWRMRPLRLAFERGCIFRTSVQQKLTRAGIDWNQAVDSDNERTVEATVSADLAVHAMLEGTAPRFLEPIKHGGTLPDLDTYKINFYVSEMVQGPAERALADLVREVFRGEGATAQAA